MDQHTVTLPHHRAPLNMRIAAWLLRNRSAAAPLQDAPRGRKAPSHMLPGVGSFPLFLVPLTPDDLMASAD